MSQRVRQFVKNALALVCNVRLNGLIRRKDYNVFAAVFHTTLEALCFVKKLAKFFTTVFHLASSFVLAAKHIATLRLAASISQTHSTETAQRGSRKSSEYFTSQIFVENACKV
jgi:hypothetical protein